jgi:hypothetical protein
MSEVPLYRESHAVASRKGCLFKISTVMPPRTWPIFFLITLEPRVE